MCGIVGIATARGRVPSIGPSVVATMRDRMVHRGPDDAGLIDGGNVLLAHRRLAIRDPSPMGRQPMATPDGRFHLVYNGELYNEPEIRLELTRQGAVFGSGCDAETVLLALAAWGSSGLSRLRGMFALALWDVAAGTLLLARDPLGIKPLHVWRGRVGGHAEIAFASEIPALFVHPAVSAAPDPVTLSSYLTTIRVTLGRRTMFRDITTLMPGESITVDLSSESLGESRRSFARIDAAEECEVSDEHVREVVRQSVGRHLVSDVPTCCLLSGGLDSTILAKVAMDRAGGLTTYCSGDPSADPERSDLAFARRVSRWLGSEHVEVPITGESFLGRWTELLALGGVPLSTPNQVAIFEVAAAMRSRGHIVTLSGEGADELFAGYVGPTLACLDFVGTGQPDAGLFHVDANAWAPRSAKAALLAPTWASDAEDDRVLIETYRSLFDACVDPARADCGVLSHLRFQRGVNLEGLLRRLDAMTMLAGVEGRTPLADVEVARMADSLPVRRRFVDNSEADWPAERRAEAARSKVALRDAFAPELPEEIVRRPKASFPLPFEGWVSRLSGALRRSEFAREVFLPGALEVVSRDPSGLWRLSWPMINLAMWGDRWWGGLSEV
ncbi:MAG: asparagine synthase (glutamine-hydrolyzing) [Phycisphaeraceae bacterium]|nr:asparagine synthase (glutamine-hydrolyzing) [Phycisphaeraceae bacterium]